MLESPLSRIPTRFGLEILLVAGLPPPKKAPTSALPMKIVLPISYMSDGVAGAFFFGVPSQLENCYCVKTKHDGIFLLPSRHHSQGYD